MGACSDATLAAMPVLRPDDEATARELLASLERPVELLVALGPEATPIPGGSDIDFAAETARIAEGVAELSEHVSCRVEQEPAGFPRFPAISIRPEGRDAGVRYDGLPWGYELGALIGGVLEAGQRESTLRPDSLAALDALDRDLAVDVFVTPT